MKKYRMPARKGLRWFTFALESEHYLVSFDPDCPDAYDCRACRWSAWRGYQKSEISAGAHERYVAERIIRKGLCCSKSCFTGEHYAARLDAGRLQVQRLSRPYVSAKKHRLTRVVCLSVQILLCLIAWLFLLPHVLPWLRVMLHCRDTVLLRVIMVSVGTVCSVALYVLWPHHRGLPGCALNALLPIGALCLLGVMWCHPFTRIVALILAPVTVLVSVWYDKSIADVRNPDNAKAMLRASAGWLCMIALMSVLCTPLMPVMIREPSEMMNEQDRAQIAQRYIEACSFLEYDEWMSLPAEKKLEYMQSIADYECVFELGLSPVPICAAVFDDPNLYGTYDPTQELITLSYDVLCNQTPSKVLDTTLHEVRHVYQHKLVDLYVSVQLEGAVPEQYQSLAAIQKVQGFASDFQNYCDGSLNFNNYYQQSVERDSREWAHQRICDSYGEALGR